MFHMKNLGKHRCFFNTSFKCSVVFNSLNYLLHKSLFIICTLKIYGFDLAGLYNTKIQHYVLNFITIGSLKMKFFQKKVVKVHRKKTYNT